MTQPTLIMDQHFRKVEELFSPATFHKLEGVCRIEGARNWQMDEGRLSTLLEGADFLVAARPALSRADLDAAPNLRAVIEVSGAFYGALDYDACFERGIEVLSCAPGFRRAVAEMGFAMILAGARGLVAEHEAFRSGAERWLDDRAGLDFTLHGQNVGFVGYGNIARELHRLMSPFDPTVTAYDPWITEGPNGVTLCELTEIFRRNRVVIVTAVPSEENQGLVNRDLIATMPAGSLLVLLSRAHVIDFEAACDAAREGYITFATDVFPTEPLAGDDSLRNIRNVILSPHRAAAVEGGRHPIGEMILHDVSAIIDGKAERQLLAANAERIEGLIAAQHAMERTQRFSGTQC